MLFGPDVVLLEHSAVKTMVAASQRDWGIQRVFVKYSEVFGMVLGVFGFCAHLQMLPIPHLVLLQIPANYPFYNIKRDECGNQGSRKGWSGLLVPQATTMYRILLCCSCYCLLVLIGHAHNMPKSNVRKEPPPARDKWGKVVPHVCIPLGSSGHLSI